MICFCVGPNKKAQLVLAIFLMIFIHSLCTAAPIASVGLSGGIEAFHLKEFQSSGTRLLSETGNRFVTTAFLDNGDKYALETPLLFHLEASAYWGQVDYDGESQSLDPAQSSLPLMSQTDYQGVRAEALIGLGFKPSSIPWTIGVMSGLGLDGWNRRIHSATTSNGTFVSGIEESYKVYYGKIALRLSNSPRSPLHSQLQFGVKIPFNISEDINLSSVGYDNNLTLSPGNAVSGFINLVLEPQSRDSKTGNPVISVYYDSYRFDPSKTKTVTRNSSPVQVWQPETHIDIFGLQLGYRF